MAEEKTKALADIENNELFNIIFDDGARTPPEKMEALTGALAYNAKQSPAENQARLDKFDHFDTYLQDLCESVEHELNHVTDPNNYSEISKFFRKVQDALEKPQSREGTLKTEAVSVLESFADRGATIALLLDDNSALAFIYAALSDAAYLASERSSAAKPESDEGKHAASLKTRQGYGETSMEGLAALHESLTTESNNNNVMIEQVSYACQG